MSTKKDKFSNQEQTIEVQEKIVQKISIEKNLISGNKKLIEIYNNKIQIHKKFLLKEITQTCFPIIT